ncbi:MULTISPECIES: cupin domain-containing protein [Streptomyces]|uniref:Cupin domain-containing protein n=1 Tax=Streptomyces dengpaensis TaxID=2049881 RepID=A0ABM6T194_9ACTN|nr:MULTISPECIES: cupin domain-containing protein [Streptomyces]AVH60743.1 cupin domain-containing protein [Streptomyces dengpaensis]PIB04251.1 cupin [Streptomyces sp. HG99]
MTFILPDLPLDDPRWYQRGALYVPSGKGPTVWAAGDVYTIKATGAQTNGGFGFIEATVPAGGGPLAHVHPGEEETFYILDGELEFLDGDHVFTAVAGDFIHIPRGVRHRFTNKGNHAAKMIFMFTPAGLEQIIADHAQPARPGEAPPSQIDDEQIARYEKMAELTKVINLPEVS